MSYHSQVNIIQLQFLQAHVDGIWDVFDIFDHFGGDEQFLSSHFTVLDGEAKLTFGIVHLSAINVVKAKLYCCLDCLFALLIDILVVSTLVPGSAGAISKLLT